MNHSALPTQAHPRKPTRPGWMMLLWVLPLLFLGVFFFYPLAAIFAAGLRLAQAGGQALAVPWALVGRVLFFTLWQAALSTLLTLLVGLPAAWVFARFLFPGKNFLRALLSVPFILPTVVAAAGFNALLGPHGWLNSGLMALFNLSTPPIHILTTLWAILLAHIFYNTTVILLLVGSAWAQLDTRLEQAARVLGATPLRTLTQVTLPLLRPAIFSAALLVFLFDFTSFGVILILGGPRYATLEVEIYIQALQNLNLPLAGLLSLLQLLCTLLIVTAYTFFTRHQPVVPLMPRLRGEGMRRPRTWPARLMVAGTLLVLLVLLISPLASLAFRSVAHLPGDQENRVALSAGISLDNYRELFINRRQSLFYVPPVVAVRNSILYAAGAVLIALGLGFPAAYALNQSRSRRSWMEPVIMLPLGASAVTLGLGYLLAFNTPPLDVRSFPLMIPIAHSLVAFPFVVRTLQPALASIPERLRQSAASLGASPGQVWWEVDLPIIWRAALAAAIFSFAISLGEFGATSLLARPEYPTMPVAIYRFLALPGALNYGQALAMATILMLVCTAGIFLIDRLERAA